MKYYIGIDYGASILSLKLETNDGRSFLLKTQSYAYSVYGASGVSGCINSAIGKVLGDNYLELSDCKGICAGVAGARNISQQAEIEKNLKYENVLIKSDAEIALYAAFRENDGAILICGTGSVIYGKAGGKIFRTGGWGRIIGDTGSGYDIGVRVLRDIAEEFDTHKKNFVSGLSKKIYSQFGINGENLISKVYQEGFDIPSIAKFVIEDSGSDTFAYLKKSTESLAEKIKLFEENFSGDIPLVFSGSLIKQKNRYSEAIKAELMDKCSRVKAVEKDFTPEDGAIYLAKKYFKQL